MYMLRYRGMLIAQPHERTSMEARDEEIVRKVAWTLSEDETHEVREGLRIYRAFKSFGMIGGWVRNIVIWAAALIGGYLVIVNFFKGGGS